MKLKKEENEDILEVARFEIEEARKLLPFNLDLKSNLIVTNSNLIRINNL